MAYVITTVHLTQDARGWAVDLELQGFRELRRYRYRSEAQARFFAAVFALGPRELPAGWVRVRTPQQRRRNVLVKLEAASVEDVFGSPEVAAGESPEPLLEAPSAEVPEISTAFDESFAGLFEEADAMLCEAEAEAEADESAETPSLSFEEDELDRAFAGFTEASSAG